MYEMNFFFFRQANRLPCSTAAARELLFVEYISLLTRVNYSHRTELHGIILYLNNDFNQLLIVISTPRLLTAAMID